MTSLFMFLALFAASVGAFSGPAACLPPSRGCSGSSTTLKMGLLDSLGNFLQSRDGDFVKLEESGDVFGPGPALVLYKVPASIDDGEIQEMLSDGAPQAAAKGVVIARILQDDDELLKFAVAKSLKRVVRGKVKVSDAADGVSVSDDDADGVSAISRDGCPVLFFSGFQNQEMMATYSILGGEIYQENGASAACAKAVPGSMQKPLGQVLEEISSDHQNAMMSSSIGEAEEEQ
jgi:hypothetical protein